MRHLYLASVSLCSTLALGITACSDSTAGPKGAGGSTSRGGGAGGAAGGAGGGAGGSVGAPGGAAGGSAGGIDHPRGARGRRGGCGRRCSGRERRRSGRRGRGCCGPERGRRRRRTGWQRGRRNGRSGRRGGRMGRHPHVGWQAAARHRPSRSSRPSSRGDAAFVRSGGCRGSRFARRGPASHQGLRPRRTPQPLAQRQHERRRCRRDHARGGRAQAHRPRPARQREVRRLRRGRPDPIPHGFHQPRRSQVGPAVAGGRR